MIEVVQHSNLLLLNRLRRIARNIKNEAFQQEFQQIVFPILDMYRRKIVTDGEMEETIKKAIRQIYHLARNYQYVPNHARNLGKKYDYSDHSYLLRLEKEAEKIMIERCISF